jgi:hypothetical protein
VVVVDPTPGTVLDVVDVGVGADVGGDATGGGGPWV